MDNNNTERQLALSALLAQEKNEAVFMATIATAIKIWTDKNGGDPILMITKLLVTTKETLDETSELFEMLDGLFKEDKT